MRKAVIVIMSISLFAGLAVAAENSDQDYNKSLAKYYRFTEEQVQDVAEAGVPSDEVPVVLHLAQKLGSSPTRIAEIRQAGHSFQSIAHVRGLTASDFYVLVSGAIESDTYEQIFAKFNSTPGHLWKEIQLSDADIVNLVNIRIVASQNDYSIFEAMELRDECDSFAELNHKIHGRKLALLEEQRNQRKVMSAGIGGGF